MNARSIKNSSDLIKQIVIEDDIPILTLTETWLREIDIFDTLNVCPNGYVFLRNDRKGKNGGGVAVLCSEFLKPSVVKSQQYNSFEHLIISVKSAPNSARIVALYRPPSSSQALFIEEFTSFLEEHTLSGDPIVLSGDFNIHYDSE